MKNKVFYYMILLSLVLVLFMSAAPVPQLRWQPQLTGTFENLRSVSAISDKIAWAGGAKGTVLRTIDGGKNWCIRPIKDASQFDFRNLIAFDAHNALVLSAGSPAKVFKTSDGGKSWKETYKNTHKSVFFDSMAFWDRENGVAFSDPVDGIFLVITTSDGGDSWQRVPPGNLPKPMPKEAGFAAGGTCMTVLGQSNAWFCTGGATCRVILSNDRGKTWKAYQTPILAGKSSQGGFSIVFKDSKNGIIVGGDYLKEKQNKKNAAFTTDGGITWKLVDDNQPAGFRECAAYVPKLGNGFVITVGPSGTDYSQDGGKSWKNFSNTGFHSFSLAPGTGTGWAVGAGGTISRIVLK